MARRQPGVPLPARRFLPYHLALVGLAFVGTLVVMALGAGGGGIAPESALAVPANDNLANAMAITTPSRSGIVASGSNVGATIEAGENTTPCSGTGKTLWYTWTSPGAPGTVVFDTWGGTAGAGNDTVLAIYTGSVYPLSSVACNDDAFPPDLPSAVTLTYTANTTYRIQVGSFNGSYEGDVVLNMALGAALYVNSAQDTFAPDSSFTLREAMQVARGSLPAGLLTGEASFVKNGGAAGAAGSDLIHFLPAVFPLASPFTINISSMLPSLNTGADVLSGIGAGVTIDGTANTDACLVLDSNNNQVEGIRIQHCLNAALGVWGTGNSIGGILSVQRNTIVASKSGIYVGAYGSASSTSVRGNYIGTDGVSDLGMTGVYPDGGYGILVSGSNTAIGGSQPGAGNLISGNPVGIQISYAVSASIYGNKIGTDAAGTAAIPNGIGVQIGAVPLTPFGPSTDTRIGMGSPGYGNIIAFNSTSGVKVDAAESNALVQGNSIHSNGGPGIENTSPPAPAPAIVSSVAAGTVSGFACPSCRVDLYNDFSDEGRIWLGYTTANASGSFSRTGVAHSLPNITATSTNAGNLTSQFSSPFAASPNQDGDGLADAVDPCPLAAEDYDGYEDADGCPDTDDDGDNIPDEVDGGRMCFDPAGTLSCPSSSCRLAAEDYDAFKDTDGCPEPDNDNDGFPDATDACPGTGSQAGADGMFGAPQDLNHNGVRDGVEAAFTTDDVMPLLVWEDKDGVLDTDGCHDSPGDDFDGDGLSDDTEVFTYLTDAANPDTDGDTVVDGTDNCPNWPNAGQALPAWTVPGGGTDSDCDGFTVAREQFVGTDPTQHCNVTTAANDEPDYWPSDFNDSKSTNLSDVILMGPSYNKNSSQVGYNIRFDLNASSSVNLSDVILMGPFYNKSCG